MPEPAGEAPAADATAVEAEHAIYVLHRGRQASARYGPRQERPHEERHTQDRRRKRHLNENARPHQPPRHPGPIGRERKPEEHHDRDADEAGEAVHGGKE